MNNSKPVISTVLINWNRVHLLKKSITSYLSTINLPYELIIVDNNSSDGSQDYIRSVCEQDNAVKEILLSKEAPGGDAINLGLEQAHGTFFHVTENDIEYLAGWDTELIGKFESFPELGQISPFAGRPFEKKTILNKLTKNNKTIYITKKNLTTTCIFRREIWDKGIRWKSLRAKKERKFKFPADFEFSNDIKNLGYLVARNDKDVAVNWGFDISGEIKDHIDYYLENFLSKPHLGIEGFKEMLKRNDYDLIFDDGKYQVKDLLSSSERKLRQEKLKG